MSREDMVRIQLEYLEKFYKWLGWIENLRVVKKLAKNWLNYR